MNQILKKSIGFVLQILTKQPFAYLLKARHIRGYSREWLQWFIMVEREQPRQVSVQVFPASSFQAGTINLPGHDEPMSWESAQSRIRASAFQLST